MVEKVLIKNLSAQKRKNYFVLYFVRKFGLSNFFLAIFLAFLKANSEICIKLCVFLNTNDIVCEFSCVVIFVCMGRAKRLKNFFF
jgi:hypothetical protein